MTLTKDEFKKNIVLGWIKDDITNLLKIKSNDENGSGGANFPIALTVISQMESLGSFLTTKSKNKGADNVKMYLTCFKNNKDYLYKEGILWDIFRNGVAHDLFARGGVCRAGIQPALHKGNNYPVALDVETLAIDFLDSLDNFCNKLTEQQYNLRLQLMQDQYNKYILKHKLQIESLKPRSTPVNCPVEPSQGPPEEDFNRLNSIMTANASLSIVDL